MQRGDTGSFTPFQYSWTSWNIRLVWSQIDIPDWQFCEYFDIECYSALIKCLNFFPRATYVIKIASSFEFLKIAKFSNFIIFHVGVFFSICHLYKITTYQIFQIFKKEKYTTRFISFLNISCIRKFIQKIKMSVPLVHYIHVSLLEFLNFEPKS